MMITIMMMLMMIMMMLMVVVVTVTVIMMMMMVVVMVMVVVKMMNNMTCGFCVLQYEKAGNSDEGHDWPPDRTPHCTLANRKLSTLIHLN